MATTVFVILLLTTSVTMAVQGGEVVNAYSHLLPRKDSPKSDVEGTVEMTQQVGKNLTTFKVRIRGLSPNTTHGFHVHEHGDITSRGCKSAGGHYNPFNKTHGGPKDEIRHVGDLGNVVSDKSGNVDVNISDVLALLVGKYNIMGRAIVLHAKRDDLGRGGDEESKKTGNAGARIACGVIVESSAKTREHSLYKIMLFLSLFMMSCQY